MQGSNGQSRMSRSRAARYDLERLIRKLPIAVGMADTSGRIHYTNERFNETFGYGLDEICDSAAWQECANPDEACCRQVTEYLITGKNGKEYSANVLGAVVGNCRLILFDDTTERSRSEAALRESEGGFRVMAGSAPVMLWIAGADKGCTFVNNGWLEFTGRVMEDELGDGWAASLHPEDADRVLSAYSAAVDAREAFQLEYRLRRADGEYRWILDSGAARFIADGEFGGYVGSAMDVTDLRRNLEQPSVAQRPESSRGLAGGIGSDFNRFLGCILADAAATMSEVDIESPARDGLERIEAVAIHAAEIVHRISCRTPAAGFRSPSPGSTLIVEDEEILRMSVARMLRKQGLSIIEAADGSRAVDLIRDPRNDIALVLLDLTLPGKPSLEVFAELRRNRPAAKVILTSAYGPESMAGPMKAFGPVNFIRKPYQLRELVTVVRDALSRCATSVRSPLAEIPKRTGPSLPR
jgi:PAS domain S-box-containing protein